MVAKTRWTAPRRYLAVILTVGFALAASPAGASAELVMHPFDGGPRTNDATPTFTGTSEDRFDPVTVNVYKGETVAGSPVREPWSLPSISNGTWSVSIDPSLPLEDGTYTAIAEQRKGTDASVSSPYTFVVDTHAPTVTLDSPPARSNDTTPSFSGTASDTTPVTIGVYEGSRAEGKPVATLKAQPNGGSFVSANVSPPLASGTYTALASQPSSLSGNPTGSSDPVSFQIDTRPPSVTLTAPSLRSNDTTPSFSGSASETTSVTVEIFEGPKPEGRIVATATATPTFGSWTSSKAAPALGDGTFTALAIEPSAIGNAPGKSAPATFIVDTQPPSVTLTGPPPRSNDTTPTFSGTASESTPVTVEIFKGAKPEGQIVATAKASPASGSWVSGAASPALGDGTFTALAVEPSAIGNAQGESKPVTFVVDTKAPTVTLNSLPSPSAKRAPSFSGTASDDTPVTITIYQGATPEGTVVSTATADVGGGGWVSGPASPALEWGEYTAVARQPSSIGNPAGSSSPITFGVAPIRPAVATESASDVTRTSAALSASVNPAGAAVSACYFQYGTTSSYGASVECGFVEGQLEFPPSGTKPVPVFARIYGLSPGTTFHYRIVAVGEGGISEGVDLTFTTRPPLQSGEAARGTAPSGPTAHLSERRLRALIAPQLRPRGRRARIGALLRNGGLAMVFNAPEAGSAAIAWKYNPSSRLAHRARSKPPTTVLLAAGGRAFSTPARTALQVRLTAAGMHILSHSRRVVLTAVCVFTPSGKRPVRTTVSLTVTR